MKKKKFRKILDDMIEVREDNLRFIDHSLVNVEERVYIETVKEEKKHLRREIDLIREIKGYLEEE